MSLETIFPRLKQTDFKVTSPQTVEYNCVAWAAHEDQRWWWPDSMGNAYWPTQIPRQETLDAFVQAFALQGYEPCLTADFELDCEKLAIFADANGSPTHVARQLSNGRWSSKLGKLEDIEHSLEGLTNSPYGSVIQVLKRNSQPQPA